MATLFTEQGEKEFVAAASMIAFALTRFVQLLERCEKLALEKIAADEKRRGQHL
jgi:hypothetical protein